MSIKNSIQILDQNYLVTLDNVDLRFGTSSLFKSIIPVSNKFGGDVANTDTRFRTVLRTDFNVATNTKMRDGTYNQYAQFVIDFDPMLQHNSGLNNIVVRVPFLENANSHKYQILVEIYDELPENDFDALNNKPKEVYWGTRVSLTYWYIFCPYYIGTVKYRIKFYDPETDVDTALTVSDIFMGNSLNIGRAPGQGLSHQRIDPSVVFQADSGRKYFLAKEKYNTITNIQLPLLDRCIKQTLSYWFERVGICNPFWVVMDPLNQWDAPSYGVSFGAYRLTQIPVFQHQFYDYFSTSLSLEEIV